MAKMFAANVTQPAIDDAIESCGANGMPKDLPVGDFYESVRQFRIVDGADEVHKRTIAREAFDDLRTRPGRYDGLAGRVRSPSFGIHG